MEWKKTDPRTDISKFANIVILRPNLAGCGILEAGTGFADADENYYIFTSFDNHKLVSADDEWPEAWQWIFAP